MKQFLRKFFRNTNKEFNKFFKRLTRRYDKFYRGRYFHLSVDILILSIIISLASILFVVWNFKPSISNLVVPHHQTENVSTSTDTSLTINPIQKVKKAPSKLKAHASVLYHSNQGDQLGSGPIPPIVGLPTTYWLFFNVENDGNNVGDFLMSAKLPSNVVYTGNKTLSAGEVSYQAERHLLIWKISSLASDRAAYSAGMEISLTPNEQQIGKYCDLVTNIHYSASDLEADTEAQGNIKNMTSALDFDKINKGEGKVEDLN